MVKKHQSQTLPLATINVFWGIFNNILIKHYFYRVLQQLWFAINLYSVLTGANKTYFLKNTKNLVKLLCSKEK